MAIATWVAIVLCACHAHGAIVNGRVPTEQPSVCPTTTCRKIFVVSTGVGEACSVNGIVGPTSYSASRIVKAGQASLTDAEKATVHEAKRESRSRALRFARIGHEFVVYAAPFGVCSGTQYTVLNHPCEYYSPTDFEAADSEGAQAGLIGRPPPCIRLQKKSLRPSRN